MATIYYPPLTPEQQAIANKNLLALGKGCAVGAAGLAGAYVGASCGIVTEIGAQAIENLPGEESGAMAQTAAFTAANTVRAGGAAAGVVAAKAGISGIAAATTLGATCLGAFLATGGIVLVCIMGGAIVYSFLKFGSTQQEKSALRAVVRDALRDGKGGEALLEQALDKTNWVSKDAALNLVKEECLKLAEGDYETFRDLWGQFERLWFNHANRGKSVKKKTSKTSQEYVLLGEVSSV